jgi:protein-S-isoprenylcysteine O-methyltransferase Ste14
MKTSSESIANTAILSANIFGGISLLFFVWFLFFGPLGIIKIPLDTLQLLLWNSTLGFLFFIQHSLMIRKSFRKTVMDRLPAHFHGWVYTMASALVIFILVIFWQQSDQIIWQARGWWRLFLRVVFISGSGGILWSVLSLQHFDAFGTRMIRAHVKQVKTDSSPLASKGPYRFVRHPIYFFILLMLWSYPDITLDRLLFNILFSNWMVLATFWEEKDLKDAFGEAYRDYQKRVPMLIPWKLTTSINE